MPPTAGAALQRGCMPGPCTSNPMAAPNACRWISPRKAPIALWRIAQRFFAVLYNLFGESQDVAQSHTLSRTSHAMLSRWLRAAATLLLIEAAAHA